MNGSIPVKPLLHNHFTQSFSDKKRWSYEPVQITVSPCKVRRPEG